MLLQPCSDIMTVEACRVAGLDKRGIRIDHFQVTGQQHSDWAPPHWPPPRGPLQIDLQIDLFQVACSTRLPPPPLLGPGSQYEVQYEVGARCSGAEELHNLDRVGRRLRY